MTNKTKIRVAIIFLIVLWFAGITYDYIYGFEMGETF